MKITSITLEAYSQKTEADWYGNCEYIENPLSKYKEHEKYAECILFESKNEKCKGIEKIMVHTSEDFIKLMGWENDLKYIKN